MLIGYARVSTSEQNLNLQKDALSRAGCCKIFTDHASGATVNRAGLEEALKFAREGDTLTVWRLDRLGRSIKHLIDTIKMLEENGIGFRSLSESIDTTTAGGRLIFIIFGALAEFELNIIRERTLAGLAAARARGKVGGRRPSLNNKKREALKKLYFDKSYSAKELCEIFKISRTTLYKYINKDKPSA